MKVYVKNGNIDKAISVWKNKLKDEHFYEEIEKHRFFKKPSAIERDRRKREVIRAKWNNKEK